MPRWNVKQITSPQQSENPARAANVLTIVSLCIFAVGLVAGLALSSLTLVLLGFLVGVLPFWLGSAYRQEHRRRQQLQKRPNKGKRKK